LDLDIDPATAFPAIGKRGMRAEDGLALLFWACAGYGEAATAPEFPVPLIDPCAPR